MSRPPGARPRGSARSSSSRDGDLRHCRCSARCGPDAASDAPAAPASPDTAVPPPVPAALPARRLQRRLSEPPDPRGAPRSAERGQGPGRPERRRLRPSPQGGPETAHERPRVPVRAAPGGLGRGCSPTRLCQVRWCRAPTAARVARPVRPRRHGGGDRGTVRSREQPEPGPARPRGAGTRRGRAPWAELRAPAAAVRGGASWADGARARTRRGRHEPAERGPACLPERRVQGGRGRCGDRRRGQSRPGGEPSAAHAAAGTDRPGPGTVRRTDGVLSERLPQAGESFPGVPGGAGRDAPAFGWISTSGSRRLPPSLSGR